MSISAPIVPSSSEEFGLVEHYLRIQTNCPSLKVAELLDVSLKPISAQFDNFVANHTPASVVHVFIPVDSLVQDKNDVISHGIKVNQKDGFTFCTDRIDLSGHNGQLEYYHIKVALGATINFQDPKAKLGEVKFLAEKPTVSNLPEGYFALRTGKNSFVVFSQSQISVCHIASFSYRRGESDANPSRKSGGSIVNKCPEHEGQVVQYYCKKCHLPVCMVCKVKGDHSHGEEAKHKLVPVEQAYDETMEFYNKSHFFFKMRRQAIEDCIAGVEQRMNEIVTNQKKIEDEIMRVAIAAIEDSRMKCAEDANMTLSDKMELLRKKSDLEDQEMIFENYKQRAEPLPFLQTAFRNTCIEKELNNNEDLPPPLPKRFDLIVYGRIEVNPSKSELKSEQSLKEREIPRNEEYYSSFAPSTTPEEQDPHITHLEKIAAKKQAKLDQANIEINFSPFAESEILTDPRIRARLYLCLPFRGVPEPQVLYSSNIHSKNIRSMHSRIDGLGITCVIIKAGDQIFGGFAGSKWDNTGVPKKEKSSTFLFQINKDAFIPYGGQNEDPCYIVGDDDYISFGGQDLRIAGVEFKECSSEIENSFGVGYSYGSKKTKEFMAGKQFFRADVVEVWGFFSP